jgi:ferredoxin-nitrite reductase
VLTGVADDAVDDLLAEELLSRFSPFPGPFSRGVVACTGSEFCRFAIVETKQRAVEWAADLDRRFAVRFGGGPGTRSRADDAVVRMHFSGCSASCAQPQIADIGFRGETAHLDGAIVEAVDVGLGGSLGVDAGFVDWVLGAVPVELVPDALARLVAAFADDRRDGEPFHAWSRRHEPDELRLIAGGAGDVATVPQ